MVYLRLGTMLASCLRRGVGQELFQMIWWQMCCLCLASSWVLLQAVLVFSFNDSNSWAFPTLTNQLSLRFRKLHLLKCCSLLIGSLLIQVTHNFRLLQNWSSCRLGFDLGTLFHRFFVGECCHSLLRRQSAGIWIKSSRAVDRNEFSLERSLARIYGCGWHAGRYHDRWPSTYSLILLFSGG